MIINILKFRDAYMLSTLCKILDKNYLGLYFDEYGIYFKYIFKCNYD